MKGGYINVNAAGVNLSAADAETVTGLHEQLYTAMDLNKPIVLYNVLGGADSALISPLACACTLGDDDLITVVVAGGSFTVSKADLVTVVTE